MPLIERNEASSVGEKLAKMERRSIRETWLLVGGEAVDGDKELSHPLLSFFAKTRFVRAPSESWRRLKVSGLPCQG